MASKGKCSFRTHVQNGIVKKIGGNNMYLVEKTGSKNGHQKWYHISNLRLLKEQTHTTDSRKQYLIPLRSDDVGLFQDSGFQVRLNPVGDGNCQFGAFSDQLREVLGIEHSAQSLRREVVKYLRQINNRIAPFVEGNINTYLQGMAEESTFGDHLTLQAIADYYSININVVLPSGVNYCTLSPQNSLPITTINLGYLPEGQGDHYLSISRQENASEFLSEEDEQNAHTEDELDGSNVNKSQNVSEEIINQDNFVEHTFEHGDNNQYNGSEKESISGNIGIAHDTGNFETSTENTESQSDSVVNMEITNVSYSRYADMGSWILPLEVTVQIMMYSTSVDISSRQRLRCVCKHFKDAVNLAVTRMPTPSLYFSPPMLASILNSDHLIATSVSVSKILRNAGPQSGLALKLKSFLKTPNWNKAWIVILHTMQPGWYNIIRVYWRANQKK